MSTDPHLAGEFVKFLNTQLQECREQLQQSIQGEQELVMLPSGFSELWENALLREQVKTIGLLDLPVPPSDDQETIGILEAELEQVKEELAAAREDAETKAQDATKWRIRYETSLSSAAERDSDIKKKSTMDQLFDSMCLSLSTCIGSKTTSADSAQEYTQFRSFMADLSGSLTSQSDSAESRVVFDLPKLQILSKAARNACDDSFGFYGDLLQWCASPSQNALLYCPEYTYISGGGNDGAQQWAHATEWSSLVGRRLELFDTNGEHLVYAGTFLVHKGPMCFGWQDLPHTSGDGLVNELAQRTFNGERQSLQEKCPALIRSFPKMSNTMMSRSNTIKYATYARRVLNSDSAS
ncbi:hypothetical protein NUW54_g10599 [Trametes sanguinea]|uniref:Uncharacterized protein n=1 Tax=Trametes sanguinea TaxID=158606 RepID=A0ACC1NWU5_9APHY|nr:hypothetical protein NUW54_g10599 [Trametes sanguinea]